MFEDVNHRKAKQIFTKNPPESPLLKKQTKKIFLKQLRDTALRSKAYEAAKRGNEWRE